MKTSYGFAYGLVMLSCYRSSGGLDIFCVVRLLVTTVTHEEMKISRISSFSSDLSLKSTFFDNFHPNFFEAIRIEL